MDYLDIRERIRSGDLIFFKAEKLTQKFITAFTGGSYSHCGIAVWVEENGKNRLMLAESNKGGRRLVSLSSYSDRSFTVVRVAMDYSLVSDYVTESTGVVQYSYLDFILIGLKDLMVKLGVQIWVPNAPGDVCSEFLAHVLQMLGFALDSLLVSPSSLFKELHRRDYVIFAMST